MEPSELQDALEVIDSTNLKYFTKEMIAEFMALKGSFLAHIGRSEDANKSFSAAVQLHDSLVKAWALWGDYLNELFANERNLTLGASALTCYLHACRNQGETKCRKYLARIIWMLTYDDEKGTLAETVDKYYIGISPVLWLPWIPQLLTCLVRKEGNHILNLLCSVGKAYPQSVYFPIRTLYLTLKMEQREKHKADQQSKASTPTTMAEHPLPTIPTSTPHSSQQAGEGPLPSEPMDTNSSTMATAGSQGVKVHSGSGPDSSLAKQLNQVQLLQAKISAITSQLQLQHQKTGNATPTQPPQDQSSVGAPSSNAGSSSQTGESVPIRAPASLWRCSRIMHLLRDLHPTLLSALEGIVDQVRCTGAG
jgi:transformation/transcription domain-associated protein